MAGRPKKIDTEEKIARRRLAGWRLKEYRKTQGMTQEQLADVLDSSVPSIRRYETGAQDMSPKFIKKLIKRERKKHLDSLYINSLYWMGCSEYEMAEYDAIEDTACYVDEEREAKILEIGSYTEKSNAFLEVYTGGRFRYKSIEFTAEYELDGLTHDGTFNEAACKYKGPHLIYCVANPSIQINLAEIPDTPAGWNEVFSAFDASLFALN